MNMKLFLGATVTSGALLAAACGGDDEGGEVTAPPGATPTASESPSPSPTVDPGALERADAERIRFLFQDWPRTDPATLTVPPREIQKGCPFPDCIPALDVEGAVEIASPRGGMANFAPVTAVDYDDRLPVAFIRVDGEVKGYPLHIMTLHEIVNDEVAGIPIAVTYCPLCNTALSFDRRVDGRALDFGVSGNLRHSDLVMFDRQTESWWQQAIGEAIAGEFAGERLRPISTSVVSFGDFAASFPDALILTEDTGFGINYGFNPYDSYDRPGSRPFLFQGDIDPRRDGLERVVGLEFDGAAVAVPYGEVSTAGVANLRVGDQDVAVFWAPGTVSVLDASDIVRSKDIGAAVAYDPVVDGQRLTFEAIDDGLFRDLQTDSTWMVTGVAVDGPLAGAQLEAVTHTSHFWFAWASFFPDTEVWEAPA